MLPAVLTAQGPAPTLRVSGLAVPAWYRADRVPGGGSLDEVKLVQPILMSTLGLWRGRVSLKTTLDFEGLTMEDGELSPGAWGEGFIDRRHPHTYVHELMLTGTDLLGSLDGPAVFSISLGKGFVPFGTDDPMSRPAIRYPVNHHLSQILERAVVMGAVRAGPVGVEGSLFNGDEPERPGQWPRIGGRFGDSWSLRLTLYPLSGLELQGSRALVHSPEHRPGAGLDVTKWSTAARWQRDVRGVPLYAMVEWAESSEADRFFVFESWLGELQVTPARHRGYYRYERTDRPEESRTTNPFRSVRPHLENSILGVTRWTVHTLGYGYALGPVYGRLRLEPFGEVSRARVEKVGGGLFDPASFYGDTTIWSVTVGLRLDWGMRGHRMGRYGAAQAMATERHGGMAPAEAGAVPRELEVNR
ncbi:MAG: hypothetical protein AB7I33_07475 [Gemmatimonadales bacterium]